MSESVKELFVACAAAAMLVVLSGCGGGGSAPVTNGEAMQPGTGDGMQPGDGPFQGSPPLEATCDNGRCIADYRGYTLRAGHWPDGSSGYGGSAFQDVYDPPPQMGSATYVGSAAFRVNPRTSQSRNEYGTATLNADFGATTIGGTVEGTGGSSVRLTLNPATPINSYIGAFSYFESSPRNPSPGGGAPVTCQTGIACDGGMWWGEFGHADTVGANFHADRGGQRVIEGQLIGARVDTAVTPEPPDTPEPVADFPAWPVMSPAAARSIVGGVPLTRSAQEIEKDYFVGVDTHSLDFVGQDAAGCANPWGGLCSNRLRETQAVMEKRDIPVIQVRDASAFLGDTDKGSAAYLGFLDYGFFFVGSAFALDRNTWRSAGHVHNWQVTPEYVTASGRWSGLMIGMDVSGTASDGHIIQGDASVVLTEGRCCIGLVPDMNIHVSFTDIYDLNSSSKRPDMEWQKDNALGYASSYSAFAIDRGTDRQLFGNFTGPSHNEVVGTFQTQHAIGAFGAKHQQ